MRDGRRARNFCLDIITDIIAVYGIPHSPSVSYADSSLRREPWISSELFNFLFRVSHFYLIKKSLLGISEEEKILINMGALRLVLR